MPGKATGCITFQNAFLSSKTSRLPSILFSFFKQILLAPLEQTYCDSCLLRMHVPRAGVLILMLMNAISLFPFLSYGLNSLPPNLLLEKQCMKAWPLLIQTYPVPVPALPLNGLVNSSMPINLPGSPFLGVKWGIIKLGCGKN